MQNDASVTTGVRLPRKDRQELEKLALRYHNKPAGLIRLAVENLIDATRANGGQQPPSIRAMQATDKADVAAADHALTGNPEATAAANHPDLALAAEGPAKYPAKR